MCGRYTFEKTKELGERYNPYNPLPTIDASFNIAPGTINPVVAKRSPVGIYLMKWGLVPFWAKDPRIGYKMINARAEDIEKKPSFRKPIRTQRCLIPATGFYEWKKLNLENKEEKFPWFIRVKDQNIFSFAGIYDVWKDAEGHEILTYAIITTTPNKTMGKIHNRMPVILETSEETKYLDEKTELNYILNLLKPFPDAKMECWPVSLKVNNPQNDSPQLIARQDKQLKT